MIYNEEIECASRENLKNLQSERLVKVVKYIYDNSPVYKQKFDKIGIIPTDIKSIDDIYRLDNIEGPYYDKMKAWTLSYLFKWNILEQTREKIIKLSPYKYDFIKNIVGDMEYEDMFFNEGEQVFVQNKIRTKIKRNILYFFSCLSCW